MVITKDLFAEAFGLPIEGMVGFIDLPTQARRMRFSGTDVPFLAPNKKKEMKVEYRLLHDIVEKALCAKHGSFDVTLVAMVHTPSRQSQGFAVQLSVLLERVVKADLGESVKLHPLKRTKPVEKEVEKEAEEKKKKEKVVLAKKQVVAGNQDAPEKSTSGTSSDEDSRPLSKLGVVKKDGTAPKRKLAESNYGQIPEIPAEAENVSTSVATEANVESREEAEEHEVNNESSTVVRSEPKQPAHRSVTFAEKRIFAPVEIREINWVTHFLPKIDPADKGKGCWGTMADPDPVSRRRSGSAWLRPVSRGNRHFTVGGGRLRLIRSMTGSKVPSSACTRRPNEISTDGNSSKSWPEQIPARGGDGDGDGGGRRRRLWERRGTAERESSRV
ncbi:hypothetical protein F511_04417 [Dorcoceras hygrometricum]|uniref:Uncharacterized protein n=1 Tax=Dorcoceras hygrometricum TaxID=472368 RepID=A0A2Z7D5U6_9LAMI|nr:hypothetical protein F511_04417 [Dorcoceras hygrometricum]